MEIIPWKRSRKKLNQNYFNWRSGQMTPTSLCDSPAGSEINFFFHILNMYETKLKVSHKKGHVLSHHTDPRVCGCVFSFNPLAISHKQVTTSHLWTNILAYFKMYLNTFYVFTSSCYPLVTCVPFSVFNYYENLALWNFVSSRFHFNNSVYTTWQKYFVTQGEGEGQVTFNKT